MLLFRFIFKSLYQILFTKQGRTFAYLLFFYGKKKRYQPCKINFWGYSFQIPDAQSFVYQFKEIFLEQYYYFQTDKKKPLIYDCGSNVGLSVLYFKKKYPQAYIKSFEADKNIAHFLEKNLIENKVNENISIIQKAVWIDENGIEMYLEGADAGSVVGNGEKKWTESIRLKNLLAQEKEIDMLKMDIEGAETQVIKDCADELYKCKNIFIEYHDYQGFSQSLSEILLILEKNNFRYFLKNEQTRKLPFIYQSPENQMDLQVNIFAVRK